MPGSLRVGSSNVVTTVEPLARRDLCEIESLKRCGAYPLPGLCAITLISAGLTRLFLLICPLLLPLVILLVLFLVILLVLLTLLMVNLFAHAVC